MKKYLAVLIVAICVLLAACGKKNPDVIQGKDKTPTPAVSQGAEPTTNPGEPTTNPVEPTTDPGEPTTDPTEPTSVPDAPTQIPPEPTKDPFDIGYTGDNKVKVSFLDSEGTLIEKMIEFSEDFSMFTENTTWDMDLLGQTITLKKMLVCNTNVCIHSGTIVTSAEYYITNQNNGTLTLGSTDQYARTTKLIVDGNGVKNTGTIKLAYVDFAVKGGVAITNEGHLTVARYDSSDYYLPMDIDQTFTVANGLALVNNGNAILYSTEFFGDTDHFIENNKNLSLITCTFSSNSNTYVINNDKAYLCPANTGFFVNAAGKSGVINYGTIGTYLDSEYSFELNNYPHFEVKDGTGLINYGRYQITSKFNVAAGIGVENKENAVFALSGDFTDIKYASEVLEFFDVETGLGIKNEGYAGLLRIYVKNAKVIENKGTIKSLYCYAVVDNYTGVMVENLENGLICQQVTFYTSGLTDAVLLKNYGTVADTNVWCYVGKKLTNVDFWFNNNSWTFYGAYETAVQYEDSATVPCNNSALVENLGKLNNASIMAEMDGTGSNYEILKMQPGSVNDLEGITATYWGQNNTLLTIPEGMVLNTTWNITLCFGENNPIDNEYSTMWYHTPFVDNKEVKNNTFIVNNGTLNAGITLYLAGSECKGLVNNGIVKANGLKAILRGTKNTGAVNKGSVSGPISIVIKETGGQTGFINEGTCTNSEINSMFTIDNQSVSGEYQNIDKETMDLFAAVTENGFGKDTGFLNKGTINSPEHSITAASNSRTFVGIENEGKIFCDGLDVRSTYGLAMRSTEGSYIKCNQFYVYLLSDGEGTGLILYDQMDVARDIYINMDGPKNYGVMIMSLGSIIQTDGQQSLLHNYRGHSIVNDGRLHLSEPTFSKKKECTWNDVLSNNGTFTLYPMPGLVNDELNTENAGPWEGIFYFVYSD